ncbi:MAG: hypothetical protein NUW22_09350, partial [Acidobacteria bacterium]|nr:hypothetical protein [Acidobacteriota bacterium]
MTIDAYLNDLDHHLRRDAEDAALRPVGHTVEYLFAVDVPATREAGALVVRLLARVRRADGTWDKPVPAIAGPDDALAAAPTGRRLLATLLGATRQDADPVDDVTAGHTLFTLPGALALEWVPLAARAGRLVLRDTITSTSLRPLQWDDGPAWRFTLDIHDDEEGHWLSGVLIRREDRLSITDPVLLLDVGLLFTYERVATFEPGPSFGVLLATRDRDAVLVPTALSTRL